MPHALSIAQTAGTANIVEWSKLALSSPQVRVLRVMRILFDDKDRPIVLEEVVLPLERFPGLSANGGDDVPNISSLPSVTEFHSVEPRNGSASSQPSRISRRIFGLHSGPT